MNPISPIYVISKSRADSRLTVRALEDMRVPYHVVIEPQEYAAYSAVIAPEKIYQLPFSNLGAGSIPARNWCWQHSMSLGAPFHWILDDNLDGFIRLHKNTKVKVGSGTIFKAAEDFVMRYSNVAIAGFHYSFFAKWKQKLPPFYLNRRVYSCLLIRNDIPYRWRGRYNEDTDLSLRVLKDGWSTILFLAFLARKQATMTMKGGNTDELYKDDGRLKMAQSLADQHPDVVRISWKFGRWQHQVDYRPFKYNDPKLKPGLDLKDEIDNYGMVVKEIA
jgi:hypothetical protein